jgi:hypothetical protein
MDRRRPAGMRRLIKTGVQFERTVVAGEGAAVHIA